MRSFVRPYPSGPQVGGRVSGLRAGILFGVGCGCLLVAASCDNNNNDSSPSSSIFRDVGGTVLTSWSKAVSGARVYLVPADKIPTTPIRAADVLSGAAAGYDEPLEDLIRSTLAGAFPQAKTDADGKFSIKNLDTGKNYFPFVEVSSATPAGLYPGGSMSRIVRTGAALDDMSIQVTGHPSNSATYIGTSACLTCHPDFASQKTHAHRLGFRKAGVTSALQDLSRHPGFDGGIKFFKEATTANFKTNATSLWFYSYTPSRGFDKFIVAQTAQAGSEVRVYLWKDTADNKYKITMENLVNAEVDRTFVVELTYGGAVFKQRYMLQVPGAAYAGRYPFLQYQHQGKDEYYDRTRKQWRDYHMDLFWNGTTKMFKDPPKTKNIEANCMACHVTGYRYFTNTATGERLCDGVDDPAGAFDIDGDGKMDEVNTGCEMCHGPGSEHRAGKTPEFIVKPQDLSPGREAQICGRCHNRVEGNDDRKNDQPLNALGQMAPPGTSRDVFLTQYTSRKGPSLGAFWPDEEHSKSHHQQYPDFVKSKHYRNGRRLVVCSDCHNLHGKGGYNGNLPADPTNGKLCEQCHVLEDTGDHLLKYAGSRKSANSTSCTDCHYYKIAKSGAGRRGKLIGTPTGAQSDAEITYWINDISSHQTAIPHKSNIGTRGRTPGKAMPVPWVNGCATCHDARFLKFQ